jgi:hypothetical protein
MKPDPHITSAGIKMGGTRFNGMPSYWLRRESFSKYRMYPCGRTIFSALVVNPVEGLGTISSQNDTVQDSHKEDGGRIKFDG